MATHDRVLLLEGITLLGAGGAVVLVFRRIPVTEDRLGRTVGGVKSPRSSGCCLGEVAVEADGGPGIADILVRRAPACLGLVGGRIAAHSVNGLFQQPAPLVASGAGVPAGDAGHAGAVGVVAVVALDSSGTTRVDDDAVHTAGAVPAPLVGGRTAVGREGLADPLLGGVGDAGVFAPGGFAGLGIASGHAGAVPGILLGGLAIAEGLGGVVLVAVASQAVAANLLDLSSRTVGGVLDGGDSGAEGAGTGGSAVDNQIDRGAGNGRTAVVGAVDGAVTVCLPVALEAHGIGQGTLDMVGAAVKLAGDRRPAPLHQGVAVEAGSSPPLGIGGAVAGDGAAAAAAGVERIAEAGAHPGVDVVHLVYVGGHARNG